MSRDFRLFLEDIATACRRIIRYSDGLTFAEFQRDEKTFDAVVRNLEVIGEAAKRVPDVVRAHHPGIAWRKIAGLRDVIAHATSPSSRRCCGMWCETGSPSCSRRS